MLIFSKGLHFTKNLTNCKHFTTVVKTVKRGRKPSKAQELKEQYRDKFPDKLLNKKVNTPLQLYIANEHGAEIIDKALDPYLKQPACDTIVEINPGVGYLTQKLLKREHLFKRIVLMETFEHFMPKLKEYEQQYAEKVKLKRADFVCLWKMAYQDKIDDGQRVATVLEHLPRKQFEEDINAIFVGAAGSYNFYKHLINSLVFQQSLFLWGRCELYMLVPPPVYIHLTCHNNAGYILYRSTSMLFQMLFEYRFITQVPREHLLPQQSDANQIKKNSKLSKLTALSPEFLYLVKIVPRRNLLQLCAAADLPALWYFVKQNCVSRRNRIIPNLEKWVPGCGPRLIVHTQPTEPSKLLYKDEKIEQLPQYSMPCTTMTGRDFYENLNIYTQFGDLTPSQMLTLFLQFRQWPEYGESTFLASLDSTMLKLESATSADEGIADTAVIAEQDDANASDLPQIEQVTKKQSKRKLKEKTDS